MNGVNGSLYEPGNVSELVKNLTAIGSGEQLPEDDVIKNSISDFYEDAYMSRFKKVLEK